MMNFKKEIEKRAPGLNRGFFIALEGLDGAGKTTQAKRLCSFLEERGLDPLYVKEPTQGPWGQKIASIAANGRKEVSPYDELDFFVRDREEDVAANIGPALLAGRPVIADRYILSNIIYQSALGLTPSEILSANEKFPWPDLTIILETPVDEGLRRISSRAGGANQGFEERGYLGRVQGILCHLDRLNLKNVVRLNGTNGTEQITSELIGLIKNHKLWRETPLDIIDTHCHLSLGGFDKDLDKTLDRARAVGVNTILDVGLNTETCLKVIETATKYKNVRAVVGWHPHEAEGLDADALKKLETFLKAPQVVGFGEMGLDFCRNRASKKAQLKAFENQLELATAFDLPVVIHSRDAFQDTLALLSKYADKLSRKGVIHCFTRGWDEASPYLDLGFYLSFPGVISFPKAGDPMIEVAVKAPASRLLVETDAPYLTPAPFRGGRNEPSFLIYHLTHLAKALTISLEEAASLTAANARRLFRL